MTNHEAVAASLYPFSVDESLIEKACIDTGINVEGEYSVEDKASVARTTIAILRDLVVLSSESNGGYALSYDTEKLKERIFSLAMDNGLTDIAEEFDSRTRIMDCSNLW